MGTDTDAPGTNSNDKGVFAKMFLAIILTALITLGFSSLIQFGSDRQRISDNESRLEEHLRIAAGKIDELNALKMNQAVMANTLASMDATLKEIRDEMKQLDKGR